jgi:hypothetical protein
MRKIYYLFTILLLTNMLIGQNPYPIDDLVILIPDNNSNQVSIPYSVDPYPNKASNIHVDYVSSDNSVWEPAMKAAFEHAMSIWEQFLNTPVDIHIVADYRTIAGDYLSEAGPIWVHHDFGSSSEAYLDNVQYPAALANRLNGDALNSGSPDILVNINKRYYDDFYFGTTANCPDDKYDFVTTVLHEVLHGIGFISSAREVGGSLIYGYDDLPMIYDVYVRDNQGTHLTDFPISEPSSDLTDFLTSNNLFWDGMTGYGAILYAPDPWEAGSSIGHIDEDAYPPENANALMTPKISKGEAIHDPGFIGAQIVTDIGWEVTYPLGLEDEIQISGEYCTGDDNPTFGSIQEGAVLPDLNENGYYSFEGEFIDNDPYGNTIVSNKYIKFEIFMADGSYYVLEEANFLYLTIFESGFDIPNMAWRREIDGYLKGRITCQGTDDTGVTHQDIFDVLIPFEPNDCEVAFYQYTSIPCRSVTLQFYAPGASQFNVLYKSETEPYWILEIVPEGEYTYTISGLNQSLDYEFKVTAINEYGYKESAVLERDGCIKRIDVHPNPASILLSVVSEDDIELLGVEVFNVYYPNIRKTESGNGSEEVFVDVQQLPPGVYSVKATNADGSISTKTIVIY